MKGNVRMKMMMFGMFTSLKLTEQARCEGTML